MFVGVESEECDVIIFSLISIRIHYLFNSLSLQDCECIEKGKLEQDSFWKYLRILSFGDKLDLGIEVQHNGIKNRVYAIVDYASENGIFRFEKEEYFGNIDFDTYEFYKKANKKCMIAGRNSAYSFMGGGLYGHGVIQNKIWPGTVAICGNVENSKNKEKFREMVFHISYITNSYVSIENIPYSLGISIQDSTVNADNLFFLDSLDVNNGRIHIGKIKYMAYINVINSNFILDGDNQNGDVNVLYALNSTVKIKNIGYATSFSMEQSMLEIGKFDRLEIDRLSSSKIIFTNPFGFGTIRFGINVRKCSNCTFEFPNGAPIDKLINGPVRVGQLEGLIGREIKVRVTKKDYELLTNKYKIKTIWLERLE